MEGAYKSNVQRKRGQEVAKAAPLTTDHAPHTLNMTQ